LPEGSPKESFKHNITKIVYIVALLVLVAYIVYIISRNIMYIEQVGIIDVHKFNLTTEVPGKISQVTAFKGQNVNVGDILLIIDPVENCAIKEDTRIEKLKFDIQKNQAELSKLRQVKVLLQKTLNEESLVRALEINRALLKEIPKIKQDIYRINLDVELKEENIAIQVTRLNLLIEKQQQSEQDNRCEPYQLISPYPARVAKVDAVVHEYINAGKILISLIPEYAPVQVVFTLEFELFKSVSENGQFTVVLPNGSESKAKVVDINSTIGTQTKLTQVPSSSAMQVIIEPVLAEDSDLWQQYDRMAVKVRARK
jgi:multidrug resistance efflux pump